MAISREKFMNRAKWGRKKSLILICKLQISGSCAAWQWCMSRTTRTNSNELCETNYEKNSLELKESEENLQYPAANKDKIQNA